MELTSGFADQINDFLRLRMELGYQQSTYMTAMRGFDRYCALFHPADRIITDTIAYGWIDYERNCGRRGISQKLTAIRTFARYIQSMGEIAYAIPDKILPARRRFVPNIFTDDELSRFFRQVDADAVNLWRRKIIPNTYPVLFRLIYTCGLRPGEGFRAMRDDLDLRTRTLFIRETKRHKQRVVSLSPDMAGMMEAFVKRRDASQLRSKYLFPGREGRHLHVGWTDIYFWKSWCAIHPGIPEEKVPGARIYDLRHRFASATIQQWVDGGGDLYSLLPKLRVYMGHASLEQTLYYVHLLPDRLRASAAIDWNTLDAIIPEV